MKETKRIRYKCSVCKMDHVIDIPLTLIENRKHYPVTYFAIHKFQGTVPEDQHMKDADILTSFYIDQNFHVRGTEGYLLDSSGNIMAQEDAEQLILFLTNHIIELQSSFEKIQSDLVECQNKLEKQKKK